MVFEDKGSYTGDWQYGLRHGQGEYVMSDGSVYRGQWAHDKAEGKGTLSIPYSKYTYNGESGGCGLVGVVLWSCVLSLVHDKKIMTIGTRFVYETLVRLDSGSNRTVAYDTIRNEGLSS